jgi:putative Mg2+ transporter-C (MgtC) family protein
MISLRDQAVRLTLAALLGGIIGLERERLDRAAGLRTHALVAMASALVMIVSAFGFDEVVTADRTVVADPTRIAAQVVSGIGFLGAGVIILRKNTVRGLTTAASVWAVAGIGLAVGIGLYFSAAFATAIVLVIQGVLRPLEQRMFRRNEYVVTLRLEAQGDTLAAVERALAAAGAPAFEMRLRTTGTRERIQLRLGAISPHVANRVITRLRALEGVQDLLYTSSAPRPTLGSEEDAGSA